MGLHLDNLFPGAPAAGPARDSGSPQPRAPAGPGDGRFGRDLAAALARPPGEARAPEPAAAGWRDGRMAAPAPGPAPNHDPVPDDPAAVAPGAPDPGAPVPEPPAEAGEPTPDPASTLPPQAMAPAILAALALAGIPAGEKAAPAPTGPPGDPDLLSAATGSPVSRAVQAALGHTAGHGPRPEAPDPTGAPADPAAPVPDHGARTAAPAVPAPGPHGYGTPAAHRPGLPAAHGTGARAATAPAPSSAAPGSAAPAAPAGAPTGTFADLVRIIQQQTARPGAPAPAESPPDPGSGGGPAPDAEPAPPQAAPVFPANPAAPDPAAAATPARESRGIPDGHAIANQLTHAVRHVRLSTTAGGATEVNIRLVPEHLGEVSLKLVMQDGTLRAEIVVSRPEVKAALESEMGFLKDRLAQQGVDVGAFAVALGEGAAGDAAGHGRAHRWEGPRRPPRVRVPAESAATREPHPAAIRGYSPWGVGRRFEAWV